MRFCQVEYLLPPSSKIIVSCALDEFVNKTKTTPTCSGTLTWHVVLLGWVFATPCYNVTFNECSNCVCLSAVVMI